MPPSTSPASRFNLKNILGSPQANTMAGRNVPANPRQERCCFCCGLRNGVIAIASVYIAMYVIQIASMIAGTVMWTSISRSWKIFTIFLVVIGLPLCSVGLYGAVKRKKKFVYAYFLFSTFLATITLFSSFGWLIELGRGTLKQAGLKTCVDTLTKAGYDAEYATAECQSVLSVTLGFSTTIMLILAVCQVYWAYVIRRFYLQMLIEDAAANYMQV